MVQRSRAIYRIPDEANENHRNERNLSNTSTFSAECSLYADKYWLRNQQSLVL